MNDYRPRLNGDVDSWEELIELAKTKSPATILRLLAGKTGQEAWEESESEAKELFTVDNPPTNLEQALVHSKADLSTWQVQKWIWNHWAGRYQVKIWFERKAIDHNEILESLFAQIKSSFDTIKPLNVSSSGVGVVCLADFHYGFDYSGDSKNPAFSVEILTEKIRAVADKINSFGFKEVHLALLGDFIESFTGLNHMDTWKNLSSYGATAARGVSELIAKELAGRIHNLSAINIVPGNHDRVTNKSDQDAQGEAALLIADFLQLMLDVPIAYDWALLNPTIDGVKYIFTHGHLGLSKRDEYATILEHGDQSLYNVMAQGHKHTREVTKGYKYAKNIAEKTVSLEGSNFRRVVVPPLVTGGSYGYSLGVYGTAGMTIFQNNGLGGVNQFDLSV